MEASLTNTRYTTSRDFSNFKRWYLICEFVVIFLLTPICIYLYKDHLKQYLIPYLLLTSALCCVLLFFDRNFDRRRLWNSRLLRQHLRKVLYNFFVGALISTAFMILFLPEVFLLFPKKIFYVWLTILLIYPIFSVYPQEIIFRAFFFHRYRNIFTTNMSMIFWSSLSFGLAHLFFGNWVAPVITFFAGILFALTYLRTKSTLLVSIEHGLWGNLGFTLGIGLYFFTGNIPV